MTTVLPLPPPLPPPAPPLGPSASPARSHRPNPFARPRPPLVSGNSWSRTTLLPTIPSPVKAASSPSVVTFAAGPDGARTENRDDAMRTPAEKGTIHATAVAVEGNKAVVDSGGGAKRQAWRLLWRGGVEIGKDGWRLEGVTFFALLQFPSTPGVQIGNPFDQTPIQSIPGSAGGGSPFALPSADTDLCLSLESMRGRKYLRIRGLVDLKDDEVLEGSEDGGVQMSIAASSPLLIAYFTGLLCRQPTLSAHGRTMTAVVIGLGDEGFGVGAEGASDGSNGAILVYGQLQPLAPDSTSTTIPGTACLRLCVGRRKASPPPPAAKKVRPGEPLPRPPMFLPSKSSRSRPALSKSRTLSRSTSIASIYAPPPPPQAAGPSITRPDARLPSAPISGRTPGRRGEKRPRPSTTEDERRRKNGRIVPTPLPSLASLDAEGEGEEADVQVKEEPPPEDEDIFGKRPPLKSTVDQNGSDEPGSTGRAKRIRVPQQVLDNKAAIRKQTLVLLEARQIGREHALFKDVFSMTTKGVYFAFRDRLADNPLEKGEIQDIVGRHLDMYVV